MTSAPSRAQDYLRLQLTKREREEAQHRQFLAIRKSFRYFCENFVWIVDKAGQRRLLEWNDVQQHFMAHYTGMDMILKARKMGFTTLRVARMYWRNQFEVRPDGRSGHRGIGMVVTHDKETTGDLFRDKLMYLHNGLPDWLRPPHLYSSKTELLFREGGRIRPLTAGNRDIGRSQDLYDVLLSEWALYPNLKAIFSGIVQAMDGIAGAECTLESTAKKERPDAKAYWDKCRDGKLRPYRAHFYGWSAHKEYRERGEAWLQQKREQLDDLFTQEFPETAEEAWRLEGTGRFVQKGIDAMRARAREPIAVPEELSHISEFMEVYEAPDGGDDNGREPARYVVSVDTCEGIASPETDWAYINVLRWDTCEQVARLRAQIPPGDTGLYAVQIATLYNHALLAAEITGIGHATLLRIQDLGYSNIYYHRDPFAAPRRRTKPGSRHRTRKVGWQTDARTKPLMIAQLARHVREVSMQVNDKVALRELEYFLPSNEAAPSEHDDSVVTLAIGVYIRAATTEFKREPNYSAGDAARRSQRQPPPTTGKNRLPALLKDRARLDRF